MAVALITGGSSGIGLAFARRLAGSGYDLVLVARDAARLAATAESLRGSHGVDVEVLPADVSSLAGCRLVETRLGREDRPIDLLINSAGHGLRKPFLVNSIEDETRLLDVHVRATLRLCHAAGRAMSARGSGAIINVSSVAGWLPRGTYSAHKAWVTIFSEGLSRQLRGSGVRVMVLASGFVRTEMQQRMGVRRSRIPWWAWLDADDVVRAALRDLQRGVVVSVPSRRYQAIAFGLRHTPHRWLIRGAGRAPPPVRRPQPPGE
jgi:short-subunit dehydrogenase